MSRELQRHDKSVTHAYVYLPHEVRLTFVAARNKLRFASYPYNARRHQTDSWSHNEQTLAINADQISSETTLYTQFVLHFTQAWTL